MISITYKYTLYNYLETSLGSTLERIKKVLSANLQMQPKKKTFQVSPQMSELHLTAWRHTTHEMMLDVQNHPNIRDLNL